MTREEREAARTDLMLAQADVFYRPKDETIEAAIEALEQESRWVPITERLPKECEEVLVANYSGCISVGYVFENIWKSTLQWHVDCDNPEENYYFNPIAWQSLPKPYNQTYLVKE